MEISIGGGKMKFTLILVAMLLIGAASAGQVNETLGSYNVSFSMPMDVVVYKSVEHKETYEGIGCTSYDLILIRKNSTINSSIVSLSIAEYNQTINPPSPENLMAKYGCDRQWNSTQTIDNHTAVLAHGGFGAFPLPVVYTWEYSLTDTNDVKVNGISDLPWDEGTSQILKTLHIEKVPQTLIGSSIS